MSSSYRPDIDGLRALSVASVLVYHLNENLLPGGFAGVDIFFVISGYVVTSSLRNHWIKLSENTSYPDNCSSAPQHVETEAPKEDCTITKNLDDFAFFPCSPKCWFYKEFLLEFYARRIQRLYPALMTTFFVGTLIIALLIPYWFANHYMWDSAGFSILGMANIFYARKSVDYWAKAVVGKATLNPFLHMWSLGVEEQFYLVFSPLVVLTGGVNSRAFVFIMGLLVLFSGLACWVQQQDNPEWAFFMITCRFWELGLGCLLVRLEPKRDVLEISFADSSRIGRFKSRIVWSVRKMVGNSFVASILIGVALIVCRNGAQTDDGVRFPIPWALIPTLGAASYIAAGWPAWQLQDHEIPFFNKLLSHPKTVLIGQMSYCIYIIHWPVIVAFKWADLISGSKSPSSRHQNQIRFLCIMPLVLLLSSLVYYCVEVPLRSSRFTRGRVFGYAVWFTIVGSLLWLLMAKGGLHRLFYAGLPPWGGRCSEEPAAFVNSNSSQCGCRWQEGQVPPAWAALGYNNDAGTLLPLCAEPRAADWTCGDNDRYAFTPGYRRLIDDNPYTCMDAIRKYFLRPKTASSDRGVFWLFGDSHAFVIAPGLARATRKRVFMLQSGMFFPFGTDEHSVNCFDTIFQQMELPEYRGGIKAGDSVGVIYWAGRFPNDPRSPAYARFEKNLRRVQRLTLARGADVVLFADWQTLPHSGGHCFRTRIDCTMQEDDVRKGRAVYTGFLKKLSAEFSAGVSKASGGVFRYVDLLQPFCSNGTCNEILPNQNTLGFDDANHINKAGSYYLSAFMCRAMET